MLSKLTLLSALALTYADCPNACSGHGLCRDHDMCRCDPNYMGNDCSQRVCPFDLAFVDAPRGDLNHDGQVSTSTNVNVQWANKAEFEQWPSTAAVGEGHFFAECSGKGDCDRDSGECKCYTGYTGASCQRASCPKDCSGHGVCRTLREIAAGALNKRVDKSIAGHKYFSGVRTPFDYNLWDADKQQACVCDPGFSGSDCSLRQCPRGDDPLTADKQYCGGTDCIWEIQSFTLSSAGSTTYKFGFTDSLNNTLFTYATLDTSGNPDGLGWVDVADRSTKLPGATTVSGQIMSALRNIPGGLLQRVEVYPSASAVTSPGSPESRTFRVTFVGVPGDQAALAISTFSGQGKLTFNPDHSKYDAITSVAASAAVVELDGNYEEIECAGRGLCDYGAGLCKCFTGFFGAACEFQNALSS